MAVYFGPSDRRRDSINENEREAASTGSTFSVSTARFNARGSGADFTRAMVRWPMNRASGGN